MDKDAESGRATVDRRAFLSAAGKFAVITPPVMTMLLSTSLTSPAIAASGRGSYPGQPGGGAGHGNPGHGGPSHGGGRDWGAWWRDWLSRWLEVWGKWPR